MSMSKEQKLWDATTSGDLDVVKELAQDDAVNVNWKDPEWERSPFYRACFYGHVSIVQHLLAHPLIDPNMTQKEGGAPFDVACQQGHSSVVSILMADKRIDVNKPSDDKCTPLWYASQDGQLSVVQVLLASGRDIDTKTRSTFNNKTAAEHGRSMAKERRQSYENDADVLRRNANCPIIADLIDSFEKNPLQVRNELRRLPALRKQFIGYIYSLMVLATDLYLMTANTAPAEVRRFFYIASQLPLDLQMVLSNRTLGSGEVVVWIVDSENGFKWALRS